MDALYKLRGPARLTRLAALMVDDRRGGGDHAPARAAGPGRWRGDDLRLSAHAVWPSTSSGRTARTRCGDGRPGRRASGRVSRTPGVPACRARRPRSSSRQAGAALADRAGGATARLLTPSGIAAPATSRADAARRRPRSLAARCPRRAGLRAAVAGRRTPGRCGCSMQTWPDGEGAQPAGWRPRVPGLRRDVPRRSAGPRADRRACTARGYLRSRRPGSPTRRPSLGARALSAGEIAAFRQADVTARGLREPAGQTGDIISGTLLEKP